MSDCIFCDILAGEQPASVVYSDATFCAFMDIHPWRPGHLLVIPKQHCQYLDQLPEHTLGALFALGVRIGGALRSSALPCDDVHYVVNDGRAANQSVPHVHLHLVPRRRGDLFALASNVLTRPLAPFLGPTRRATLDEQAEHIRETLGA